MRPRTWLGVAVLVAGAAAVGAFVLGRATAPAADAPVVAATTAPPSPAASWLVVGGGPTPDANQVQIEQDLALATQVLEGEGVLLYAGGPGTRAVQVLDEAPRGDPLLQRLAHLFAPRAGRDAHYRETSLTPAGPATAQAFLDRLEAGVRTSGRGPLTVYLAGHGEPGEVPQDNVVVFWGQGVVSAVDLAARLDPLGAHRALRLIVTTCHSGGLAEAMFRAADAAAGLARGERCGLFATTWDRLASGCDPDPDRRRHEGYGAHFLHALRGQDRSGRPLPAAESDLDGDGRVSAREAHARVRIASEGVEVPVTTSERWLRLATEAGEATAPVALPIEDAVIAGLAKRLQLEPTRGAVATRLDRVSTALDRLDLELKDAQDEELLRFDVIAARLLSRWPVLDDPWNPDFRATLEADRAAIDATLDRDPAYRDFEAAAAHVDQISARMASLEVREAALLRLDRALENKDLAGRLAARGGYPWEVFRSLRACEAGTPGAPRP